MHASGQTERQTYIHTYTLIAIFRIPVGGEVIKAGEGYLLQRSAFIIDEDDVLVQTDGNRRALIYEEMKRTLGVQRSLMQYLLLWNWLHVKCP